MPGSEVARLRQRIQEEYEAAHRALHAPAMMAKHAYITKRQENIGACFEELSELLSPQEAMKLVVEALATVEAVRKPQVGPL